jgi:hypothetical protein
MKFHETNFDEYLLSNSKINLHPKLEKVYKNLPEKIEQLGNLIFYGPSGAGKYTQALTVINRYSPSKLKYEKKLSVTYNKNTYFFKISDIHYEIDFAILGCHAKLLWYDVYSQIMDVILVTKGKTGIIVCKNFHDIHNELLDIFYSYMQTMPNDSVHLKFILLTESVSFIPDNIINTCMITAVPRPSRVQYNKCFFADGAASGGMKSLPKQLDGVANIKNILSNIDKPIQPYEVISNSIYMSIVNLDTFDFYLLREQLYDILIYNLNMNESIWFIIEKLVDQNKIAQGDFIEVLSKVYDFFRSYNNNYRPIYHLERLMMNLIKIIHKI